MAYRFIKLSCDITKSTIWAEDHATFRLWVYLMAEADRTGVVRCTVPGFANNCRMTIAEVEVALRKFESPDKYSANPEYEGRRIERVQGGWRLLNYDFYRDRKGGDPDWQKERHAVNVAASRDRQKDSSAPGYVYYARSPFGIKIGFSVNPWARVHEMKCFAPNIELLAIERGSKNLETERHKEFTSIHIEREWFKDAAPLVDHVAHLRSTTPVTTTTTVTTEAEAEEETKSRGSSSSSTNPSSDVEPTVAQLPLSGAKNPPKVAPAPAPAVKPKPEPVEAIYQAYPRHVGKRDAITAIERAVDRLVANEQKLPTAPTKLIAQRWLYSVTKRYSESPAGKRGTLTPHPATWFNQSRYLDDPKEWDRAEEAHNHGPATKHEATQRNLAAAQSFIQRVEQGDGHHEITGGALHVLPAASGPERTDLRRVPGEPRDAGTRGTSPGVLPSSTGTIPVLPNTGRTAATGGRRNLAPTF